MAFRASNVIPSEAYTLVKRAAVQLKLSLQGFNAQLAAEGADYPFLLTIYLTLDRAENQFITLKDTPGLSTFAKEQESDLLYSVTAEFASMLSSITAAKNWMDSNVPTNVTIKSPAQWSEGTMILSTFTAGQTAGLRTALSAVISAIE
ncbi:hypothetical protein Mal15_22120 [Stieleria maiorica]|uniref:Uncharacterized protein n=1 Tax=Stieleria maiorica TaxID=2795974 RepID=A0A5B9MEZ6_9BACT|nr:hypothetical protein [Stieleria maiorica]QEF98164.1 hypothetical protein Mal15_22120 [Stieleria maiorica]